MKLLRDSDRFLKLMKCFQMSKREINTIYMDLMVLKFHQGPLAIISLTPMIFLETSLPLLVLTTHQTVHFLMHISRLIWEEWMVDLMEAHLTTLIQKLRQCHHIFPHLMELLELEVHHTLPIFQKQPQGAIVTQLPLPHSSNSYLHKDKL